MYTTSMQRLSRQAFLGPRGIEQAVYLLSPSQKLIIAGTVAGLIAAWSFLGLSTLLLYINAVFTCIFLLATLYRMHLIDTSLGQRRDIHLEADELIEPAEGWPHYVIQVPMYKEPHALPHLVEGLCKLDYPTDKLTIQLLIEEDDEETNQAAAQIDLPPQFVIVSIPVSYPRTKPKACNVGLAEAIGDFLVIYDAEDRPDPDQLKKAVTAFAQSPENTACIQAKLNFYNTDRNILTRLFTAEYALWFDLCLPALDYYKAPVPLGGTSNHFRLSVLRDLKGWDEYNVTEDCDLGLRLFLDGWQTRILNSTTWEEACPHFFSWIRQRSRWAKGYMQTYLVHTRNLSKLTWNLGIGRSIHFHLLVGGSVFCQLVGLVYWFMVLAWAFFYDPGSSSQMGFLEYYFPGPVFTMGAFCLFVGNFIFAFYAGVACLYRGVGSVVKWTCLMPIYWLVMSWAAWKGALQLIWNPHYWEKTSHLSN